MLALQGCHWKLICSVSAHREIKYVEGMSLNERLDNPLVPEVASASVSVSVSVSVSASVSVSVSASASASVSVSVSAKNTLKLS